MGKQIPRDDTLQSIVDFCGYQDAEELQQAIDVDEFPSLSPLQERHERMQDGRGDVVRAEATRATRIPSPLYARVQALASGADVGETLSAILAAALDYAEHSGGLETLKLVAAEAKQKAERPKMRAAKARKGGESPERTR